MKIKNGYVKRTINSRTIIVPLADCLNTVSGIIELNESAAFLWDQLERDTCENELISALVKKYLIDTYTATEAVTAFLDHLIKYDILQV